jgi:hypothetical protein
MQGVGGASVLFINAKYFFAKKLEFLEQIQQAFRLLARQL